MSYPLGLKNKTQFYVPHPGRVKSTLETWINYWFGEKSLGHRAQFRLQRTSDVHLLTGTHQYLGIKIARSMTYPFNCVKIEAWNTSSRILVT